MHIEFNSVTLHNFMSFGHSTLNFSDDGFIKVTGINEDVNDSATSNGSGKSSLWEGIVWAITGDTIRGTKYVSNLHGEDGTYVDLTFKIDNTEYRLLRSKDHKVFKTNLQIWIDGQDKSGKGIRESSALLVQYLPDVTASLLGSVIILGQGLPQKFTNNTPAGRKDVLEKLSKSDFMIEDLKDRVAQRRTAIASVIREHEDKLVSLRSKAQLLTSQIESSKNSLATMDKSALIEALEKIKIQEDELQTAITEKEAQLESLNKESLELQVFIANIEKQRHGEEKLVNDAYIAKYTPLNERHATLRAELRQAEKALYDAENIREVCPTCGQRLNGVVKPDLTPYKNQIASLDAEMKQITEQHRIAQDEKTAEMEEIAKKYSEITADKNCRLKELCALISQSNEKLRIHKYDFSKVQNHYVKCNNDIAQFDATVVNLNNIITQNQEEIISIENLVLYNMNEIEAQQLRLDIISKFETILKRDFRGYLLSNVISYIRDRAKEYSKIIFETDAVEFKLDGNNIEISYLNKSYENLSGGERQKIDLIIQFAIRDMLCNHLGFTSNILVLDEVFDGLDMIGCQRVLDVISAITDIKNIFIVTHRKDLSIPSDKEIVVVKSPEGISEIRG